MRWADSRISVCLLLIVVVVGTILNGCARHPWTETVEGERKAAIQAAFLDSISERSRCGPGSDSELALTWETPTRTYSFEAYCQLLEPTYLKLAVSSPLGLPLLVIATNGQSYQLLDAVRKTSTSGDLGSWAAQNNIDPTLVNRPWVIWLTGRSTATASDIAEIRLDERNRGAWLKIMREGEEGLADEYILFDAESGTITERMILDDLGRRRGLISYERWQQNSACPRPVEISITGLPYNISAGLLFDNIEPANLAPDSFILAVPASFKKEVRP